LVSVVGIALAQAAASLAAAPAFITPFSSAAAGTWSESVNGVVRSAKVTEVRRERDFPFRMRNTAAEP